MISYDDLMSHVAEYDHKPLTSDDFVMGIVDH